MGSTWALVFQAGLLLAALNPASQDELDLEQREVTFDIGKIMQEMQIPDSSLIMQRQLDLSELLNPEEFPVEQIRESLPERGGFRPGVLTPRGRQPSFGPRSFGGPPMLDYPVQFPLSQPTPENIEAICLHGDHRPRYPDSYFPASGFGQQKRRASAVNSAESWFATCCEGNQTWGKEVTLCCATQAWELSVNQFCAEDSSVKDHLYHCCRLSGSERLNCFNGDAPNPNYDATELLPVEAVPSKANFTFDNSNCQRTKVTPYRARVHKRRQQWKQPTSKKVDINFPPGRPTGHNVKSICRNQVFRPVYNIKCLPAVGYEGLARQAKAINHLEHAFKRCCKRKTGWFNCAQQKWRVQMNKFCAGENGDFHCCAADKPSDRLSCFQSISPDPHYNLTSTSKNTTLKDICETHKLIKRRFPVGFPLKTIVSKCCPLSEEEKTTCLMQNVMELAMKRCPMKKINSPAVRRCCAMPGHETPHCFSKMIEDSITKAADVQRRKMRRKCPLS